MTATDGLPRHEIVDALCQRFERDWMDGSDPEIRDFLSGSPPKLRRALLLELLQIDLERRWQASASGSKTSSAGIAHDPLLEDYVAAFPELGAVDQLPIEAVMTEFRVRWSWGDRPGLEHYVSRFGDRSAELLPGLKAALKEFAVEGADDAASEQSVRPAADRSTAFRRRATDRNPQSAQSPSSPDESLSTLSPGDVIDGYVLVEKLGAGGCGVVFRGHRKSEPLTSLALKVVRPDRLTKRKVAARFEQEVQIARELSHPNIVAAPDSGQWRGLSYLVMEFVSGTPLDQVILHSGRLSIPDACEVVRQAAVGLQYMHEAGYRHRDLKPSNLMLTAEGIVKILDFGMAGLNEPDANADRLTSLGEAFGTPSYMAPEQWADARTVDIRADIYSLGCTLNCLLTGGAPFETDGHGAEKLRVESGLPPELVSILHRCLEQQPEHRFAVPAELAQALEPFCRGAALAQWAPSETVVPDLAGESATETLIVSPTPAEDATDENAMTGAEPLTPGSETDGRELPFYERPTEVSVPMPMLASKTDGQVVPSYERPTLVSLQASSSGETDADDLAVRTHWESRRDELTGLAPSVSVKPASQPTSKQSSKGSSMMSSRSQSSIGKTVVLRQREVLDPSKPGSVSVIDPEFEIGTKLGEGGMGVVYQARQGAVDRTVAVKVIRDKYRKSEELKEKFVTEAVVTGDLAHPGIIPIYDLGTNADGEVFYAMKVVRGSEWKKTIATNSESDNLDVLMRVADAIAFAHQRGIVHRDLKPENIMLGEYGEVLVMDWGLAWPMPEYSKTELSFSKDGGGTPAYMAPEMAKGESHLIGPASDIYLLGGILFQCVAGKPPHRGKHGFDCVRAAGRNEIVPTDCEGELLQIAYRAMATLPQDRFASVKDFQAAIKTYREHAESLRLTRIAEDEFRQAVAKSEYPLFEDAIAAFRNALRLWPDNEQAQRSLIAAQWDYAKLAFGRGDLDLAAHQLEGGAAEHAALAATIRVARQERDAQRERARRMKRLAIGSAAAVLVVFAVASFLIHRSWRQEQLAHAEALQHFQESLTAIERLTGISQDLENFPRLDRVRRNLLETAAKYYRELTEQQSDDPDIQLARAQALLQLGEVYSLLVDHQSAVTTFVLANELSAPLARSTQRPDLRDAATLVLLKSFAKQAQSQRDQRQLAAAEKSVAAGLAYEVTVETLPIWATRGDLFMQHVQLHQLAGRWVESRRDIEQAQELYSRAEAAGDGEFKNRCRMSLALSFDHLAIVEEHAGQLELAEQALRRSIDIWEALYGLDADIPAYLEGLASSHVLLSNMQRGFGRDGEQAARDAIKAYEGLLQARPEVPRYQFNVANEFANLAYIELRAGRTATAQETAVGAVNRFIRLLNEYPDEISFADGEASALTILSECLRDGGKYDLAAEKLDEAITHFEARSSDFPEIASYPERLAESLSLRAQVAELASQPDESRKLFERALKLLETPPKSSSPTTVPSTHHGDLLATTHQHLADLAWTRGEKDLAKTHAQAAIKQRDTLPTSPDLQHHFGGLLAYGLDPESRQPQRAIALLKQAATSAPTNADYWFDLAFAQTQTQQWSEVAQSLDEAKKCSAAARGQSELIQSIVERQQGRAKAADDLVRRGSEQLDKVSPGNPRLRRLKLLATQ